MKSLRCGLCVIAIGLLSGCHSLSGSSYSNNSYDDGAQSYAAGSRGIYSEDAQLSPQAMRQMSARQLREMRERTVFHFGFDKDIANRDDMPSIAAHGMYLAKHPNANVRLEGHTDQIGSREYNVGLGERRDKSVKEVLIEYGASPSQIKMISYGQERPVALGHDPQSYAQNRRVEIIYQQYS